MTTTQITTLEQAEIALYRANAVQQYNNQPMVEGKQLLEICGLGLTNPKQQLDRQIDRHALVEGSDFQTSVLESSGGRPSTQYHFTINAANHILLAAMTPQGYEARQEAIDNQQRRQEEPASMLDIFENSVRAMREMHNRLEQKADRETVEQQGEQLEEVQSKVASLEHRVDARGCKDGYILRSDAYRQYHRGLSVRIFEELLLKAEVPSEGIMLVRDGGIVVNTIQVHEESVAQAVETFYNELTQVSATRYQHPLFGNVRFQA